MKTKIFQLFFLVLAIGCSTKFDSRILIGKYYFDGQKYSDTIFIQDSGRYIHKCITNNGDVVQFTGSWEYNNATNEVLFKDFMDLGTLADGLRPANWYSKIKLTSDGEVRLVYSSENNIYYRKE